jgi:hypothetical protein
MVAVRVLLKNASMAGAELIWRHSTHVRTPEGIVYAAQTYAAPQRDGTWAGWLEFTPVIGDGPVLRTERETTQPSKDAVLYWATGIEPVYLQGAFERRAHVTTSNAPHR